MNDSAAKTVRPEDVLWNDVHDDICMVIDHLGIPDEMWREYGMSFYESTIYSELLKGPTDSQIKEATAAKALALQNHTVLCSYAKGKPPKAIEYLSMAFGTYSLRMRLFKGDGLDHQELLLAASTKMTVAFSIAELKLQDAALKKDRKNGAYGGRMKAVNKLIAPMKVWAIDEAKSYPFKTPANTIAKDLYVRKLPDRFKQVDAEDPQRIIAEAIRLDRKKQVGTQKNA